MCMFCEKMPQKNDIFAKYGIIVKDKTKQKMHFLKDCLFDLVFENVFVDIDDNYTENMFVSREVFDFIVKGIEDNNYTRLVEYED